MLLQPPDPAPWGQAIASPRSRAGASITRVTGSSSTRRPAACAALPR
ncbi:hypothetical protein ACT80S_14065 [Ramlibacter sp. MAHUQ-53]